MAKVRLVQPVANEVTVDDFSAYVPQHTYIFRPTGEIWTAAGVNSRVQPVGDLKANQWIDRHNPVEQMTWWPGAPVDIRDKLAADGGWITKPGCTVFNLYRPPTIRRVRGDASRWRMHIENIYGEYAEHIVRWCAHRVQFPGEKINHSIVLGGNQGIGKDTLLEPVKQAVGEWNFAEVSPANLHERFNPFLRNVILRVSEAREVGQNDRFAFYDLTKTLMAAPPNTLRIDEKNIREYHITNVVGIIITTNNKNALHIPPDDRRHYVAWSDKTAADFEPEHWDGLYYWYEHGGYEIIANYLAEYDLTEFNPKAPPAKTQAWREIVASSVTPENGMLMDAIESLQTPNAVTIDQLRSCAESGSQLLEWLNDRKTRNQIGYQLEKCGYTKVVNEANTLGLYKIQKKYMAVYAKIDLTHRERTAAASALCQISTQH